MRIAIVGAGAVGSVIAGYLLEHGGHQVSLLARGPHLAAIQAKGLTVLSRGRRLESRPLASDDPAAFGRQDVVIVTVKAHSLPDLAPRLAPLFGPETLVVSAQNGVPWWYFYGSTGADADTPFATVDPDGRIWRAIGPERAIGCVIALPASIAEPGVAHHGGRLRLHIGAPRAGDHAAQLASIAGAFEAAGIETKVSGDIRHDVWEKLLRNNAFGTSSVLTGATTGALHNGPGMIPTIARIMRECLAVAHAWGIELEDKVDAELAAGAPTPSHKTSMLQDYEAGRPLELDPIVTAVIDLARRRQVPVPAIETLWALTQLKVATRGFA